MLQLTGPLRPLSGPNFYPALIRLEFHLTTCSLEHGAPGKRPSWKGGGGERTFWPDSGASRVLTQPAVQERSPQVHPQIPKLARFGGPFARQIGIAAAAD